MGSTKPQGEVVRKYLAQYPDTPSLTLSKLIYKENSLIFKDIENVRYFIRYYRGNSGVRNKLYLKDKSFVRQNTMGTNPFDDLPEGLKDFNDWSPYQLPFLKTLCLYDAHVPYHDKEALKLALKDGMDSGCEGVFLGGDFSDFFAVSFWEKDPYKRDLNTEIDAVKIVLDVINRTIKPKKIIYKLGNHEERYIRYMRVKAPELLKIKQFKIEEVLDLKNHNTEIVQDKRICKFGEHLHVIHGHEFGGDGVFSPVNPARGLYMRGKECAIAGHNHQTSQHTEVSMGGKVIATWSVGCLSDLHPEYKPINKWNHGFAIIDPSGEDGFQVQNKKIIEGRIFA